MLKRTAKASAITRRGWGDLSLEWVVGSRKQHPVNVLLLLLVWLPYRKAEMLRILCSY